MRRKLIAGLVVAGALVAPASAGAHYSAGWYWSEHRAETKVLVKYDDVVEAECDGWGKPYKQRLFKHFDCVLTTDAGDMEEWVLHVTGRRGFKLLDS